MPLTRVTSGVITSNAITTDKIAPGAVNASSISSLATLSAVSLSATQVVVSSVNYSDRSIQSTAGYTGFRNRIINGDMRIDQRNAGAAVTTDGSYVVDRMYINKNNDGAFSAQQDSSAPASFVNSIKFTTTTADSSLTTTQNLTLFHRIEGTNVSDLGWGTANAKTVTLSFWVRSSLTGTFGGAISNSAQNRSYPFTYTIFAADTWEQKSITITGDTSGTWLTTNGIGIQIIFSLGAGPDRSGTANAWAGATYLSATGATSVVGTNGATFYITGVQLEAGSSATDFERRPYGTELALCQRYYWKFGSPQGPWRYLNYIDGTSIYSTHFDYPVTMRTAPSVTTGTFDYRTQSTFSNGKVNGTDARENTLQLSLSCFSAPNTAGYGGLMRLTNTDWAVSSEL